MKLSIIIPTWNRKTNIVKTIQALGQQEIPDSHKHHQVELIIVDTGSTDGTMEALIPTITHPNFVYVYQKHRDRWNASIPRNLGAKISAQDTDFLFFLDSDILLPPNRLRRLFDVLEMDKDPHRVVIGPYHYMNQPLEVTNNWFESITGYVGDIRWKEFMATHAHEKSTGMNLGLACFGGFLVVPRKLFFESGGYDELITSGMEDGDFGLTLWEMGAHFSLDRELLSWHHPHEIVPQRTDMIPQMIEYIDKKHKMDLVKVNVELMRKYGFDWKPPESWLTIGGYK